MLSRLDAPYERWSSCWETAGASKKSATNCIGEKRWRLCTLPSLCCDEPRQIYDEGSKVTNNLTVAAGAIESFEERNADVCNVPRCVVFQLTLLCPKASPLFGEAHCWTFVIRGDTVTWKSWFVALNV